MIGQENPAELLGHFQEGFVKICSARTGSPPTAAYHSMAISSEGFPESSWPDQSQNLFAELLSIRHRIF